MRNTILLGATLKERLHYAMDAEFIKTRGVVMARSVAFVPFVSAIPIGNYNINGVRMVTPSPTAVVQLSGSNSNIKSEVPAITQIPTKGKHQMLIGSAPRGTAAKALKRAKYHTSDSAAHASTTSLAFATPSNCTVNECKANNYKSATAAQQQQLSSAVPQIRPLSKDIQAVGLRSIVIALKADRVMEESDVLPCGHALEYLSQGRVPVCKGSLRTGSNDIWAPHSAYTTLMNSLYNSNVPLVFDYPNPLDPYSIPCVLRHENLLRKLYKAAVRRCEESLLLATDEDKRDEFDELMTECVKLFQNISTKRYNFFRSRKGHDIFVSALAAECEIIRARRILAKKAGILLVSDINPFQELNVQRSNCLGTSLEIGNNNITHYLRGSGAGCLLSRFPSEEAFIKYLYNCYDSARWILDSTEKRYAPCVNDYCSDNTTDSEHGVCDHANRVRPLIPHTLLGTAFQSSSTNIGTSDLPHVTFICDTLVELAVVLSSVWKFLLDVDKKQNRDNLEMSFDGNAEQCDTHNTRVIANSANYFFSYANFDTQVVHSTLGLLEAQEATDCLSVSDTIIEEIWAKHRLGSTLQWSGAKPIEEEGISECNTTIHQSQTSSLDKRHHLLTSKFFVSIKDITADSLFRGGFLRSGKTVPKLTEAVEKVAAISEDAKRLIASDTVDPHNPLWDAAALATICSFLMKPP